MEVQKLKEYIINNNLIYKVLEKIGCHSIKNKGEYYQCANPDGDNQTAITVYKDSLNVIDYTRNIEQNNTSDIFSLVMFFQKCNFFQSMQFVCSCVGIDYYYDFDSELPESLKITKLLFELSNCSIQSEDENPVKPISEKILSYYFPYVNDMFCEDNIDYETQQLFEIGFDCETNRITIPIRDEIGTLVGVKGRYFYREVPDEVNKYLYIEPCSKGQILYGLNVTYDYIKEENTVYVVESEKGVMQMFSSGYRNVVATCGKKITKTQIHKLSRLCGNIVFLFDKDVGISELQGIADKFINGINLYAVIDEGGVLGEKESPSDNYIKLKQLLNDKKNIINLR